MVSVSPSVAHRDTNSTHLYDAEWKDKIDGGPTSQSPLTNHYPVHSVRGEEERRDENREIIHRAAAKPSGKQNTKHSELG